MKFLPFTFKLNFYTYYLYTTKPTKILLFWKNIYKKKKALQQNAKGLEIVRLPQQNDFRTFCMSDETEKVYHKLEEVIGIC